MRTLIGLCVLLLWPMTASAQEVCGNPCVLKEGQSFAVQFDAPADMSNVNGFRLYLDDVQLGADIPVGTTTVSSLTAPAVGDHAIRVSSFNLDHETLSPAVAFSARAEQPAPDAPSNVRIVITLTVAQNGEMKVTVKGIRAVQQ